MRELCEGVPRRDVFGDLQSGSKGALVSAGSMRVGDALKRRAVHRPAGLEE